MSCQGCTACTCGKKKQNISFTYLYRDGSNYKRFGKAVFANPDELSTSSLDNRLKGLFDEGENFIANQIGIPEVFLWGGENGPEPETVPALVADGKFNPGKDKYRVNDDDQWWHEYDGVENTDDDPTDSRTIAEFLNAVETAVREGWKIFNPAETCAR
jgi:hypothetical protein